MSRSEPSPPDTYPKDEPMKHSNSKLIVHVRHERERLAHDKTARWLFKHKGDAPLIDAKAERKRIRKGLYEKDRIRRRNAAVRRGSAMAPK